MLDSTRRLAKQIIPVSDAIIQSAQEPSSFGFSPQTPGIKLVDGAVPLDLTPDLISFRYCEDLNICKSLEATVNNWGITAGQIGFKYTGSTGSNLIHIGAVINLGVGSSFQLAQGAISVLAPNFPQGAAPSLIFMVDAKKLPPDPAWNVFALKYGRMLREFHPVLQNVLDSSEQKLEATGITDGLPVLRAGVTIRVDGVGSFWSGAYLVTEAVHTFDSLHGYQTSFTCVRP